MTDLNKKREAKQVNWTPECDHAFKKLKELLCSTRVLQSPDFDKELILQRDASERGVGAVLRQCDDSGQEHCPQSLYNMQREGVNLQAVEKTA